MGLKALLSKDGRKERALQKACAKATNKKIKPDDRRPALDFLARHGSDEAIAALLSRLTFNYDTNMVSDEEEKSFVYDALRESGDRILPSLREHLKHTPTLSWGLRLIGDICDDETTWQMVRELIDRHEPGYDRDPSLKIQLLHFIGDLTNDQIPELLLPYLTDHDETVRFTTVDALLARDDQIAREPLLELFLSDEEESLRIKNRILDGFVAKEWTVKGFRGTVEKALSDEYTIDGKGHIKRKRAKK